MTTQPGDTSGDPGHSEVPEGWHRDPSGTADQRRMGLDRNSVEGAFVDFTGRLDGRRRKHRMVAWTIIFVMFGLPILLFVVQLLLE